MKYFSYLGIFLTGIALFVALPVFALTISPATISLTGDPGRTIVGEIQLLNEQGEIKTFYSSFENFEASGESGAPHFIGSDSGLATWLKTESEVVLKSKEQKTLSFSIDIPQNAEPGGHFAAIFWGTQPVNNQSKGQVSVGGKLGILVFLKVSGQVEEGSGLLDFSAKDGRRFFSNLPIDFNYRINNTGGDRLVPLGKIKIKNIFGFTSATFEVNDKQGSVLPGSIRKFVATWNNNPKSVSDEDGPIFLGPAIKQLKDFHFGWYTAVLDLTLGENGQVVKEKFNFFVIPWQLLLVVFIGLTVILFLGSFGLKKYNRWIISKVMQSKK